LSNRPRQSKEARRKVSEARRRHTAAHPYVPGDQKRCTGCKKRKPISEFYFSKRRLKNGEVRSYPRAKCKKCERARNEAWKEEKKRNGTWSAYLRERTRRIMEDPERHERRKEIQREWATSERRRQGMKVVGPWKRYRETGKGVKLPLEPFSVWLARQVVILGMDQVCQLTGLDEKQIRRWTSGRDAEGPVKSISVEAADKVFVALGVPEEMAILYPPGSPG
jgi:hypothetical protein